MCLYRVYFWWFTGFFAFVDLVGLFACCLVFGWVYLLFASWLG